jgi:hypothetical protein
MSLISLKLAALAAVCCLVAAPAQAASRGSPGLSSNRFSVEIDGVAVAQLRRFDFLRGAASQAEAGAAAVAVVRLTRPLGGGAPGAALDFLRWRQKAAQGNVDRRSLSVIFLSSAGAELARVNLYSCAPLSWSGPDLSAASDDKPIDESIDLGCQDVELKGFQ